MLVHLQAAADPNWTNNPNMNFFKWTRDIQGVNVSEPSAVKLSLAPGESQIVFSGERILLHDNTTQYEIELKSGTLTTYILRWDSGTAPNFRTPRALGQDATTELIVSKNGALVTLTQGTGTAISTASIAIGDKIVLGAPFSESNRGVFTVISTTPTSISFENAIGTAESVTLGPGYETAIEVFSASGVQVGDNLRIYGGFSSSSWGTYSITAVYANRIEFFSPKALAEEMALTDDIAIYSSAKQLVFIESNKKISVELNNINVGEIEPFVSCTQIQPGILLKKSTIWQCRVINNSLETADVLILSVE